MGWILTRCLNFIRPTTDNLAISAAGKDRSVSELILIYNTGLGRSHWNMEWMFCLFSNVSPEILQIKSDGTALHD